MYSVSLENINHTKQQFLLDIANLKRYLVSDEVRNRYVSKEMLKNGRNEYPQFSL